MPRKKSSAKTKKITKKIVTPSKPSMFEYLRFGESYTSLVLGIIAVIIATILLLSFINNKQSNKPDSNIAPTVVDIKDLKITVTPTPEQTQTKNQKTYTVAAGDSLWKIAENVYDSGYNWVDIAKANKLSNPGNIHVGDKLVLPAATAIMAKPAIAAKPAVEEKGMVATGENEAAVSRTQRVMNDTYTVVHGDDLWEIAVRAYGDGYQWTKIAQANHLENPNVIHAGNVLKLPRE